MCAYIWKAFKVFLCVYPKVLTKVIDNYKIIDKLNQTKLRFKKVTYSWNLPMTEMASIITKSKRFCVIKGDTCDSSVGAPLQTLSAPNMPFWIIHSDTGFRQDYYLEYICRLFYHKGPALKT